MCKRAPSPKPTFFTPSWLPPPEKPVFSSLPHPQEGLSKPRLPRLVSEAGWSITVGSRPVQAESLPACLGPTHQLSTATFFIYGQPCWVFAAARLFPSCREQRSLSSRGARASHCGGFSRFRAQALGPVGSAVAKHRLSSFSNTSLVAPWPVGSSWTRDQTHVSCIGRPILYRSAIREVRQQL